jgi:transcriptional regulator with XRE-family HTH domain
MRVKDEHAAELRMIFGDAVRRRRLDLGLTQRAMANLHGFTQRTLCSVETGSRNMTIQTMARFAAAVDGEVPAMLTRTIDLD